MAFDEQLAERIRRVVKRRRGVGELKMFGGLCFTRGGNMAVGIVGGTLMVRVGPESYDAALKRKHVRPMDFTGRPLRGYVYVAPAGTGTSAQLRRWVDAGMTFAATLPPKSKPAKRSIRRSGTRAGSASRRGPRPTRSRGEKR